MRVDTEHDLDTPTAHDADERRSFHQRLRDALALLETIDDDRSVLDVLAPDERERLHQLIARVHHPEPKAGRKKRKDRRNDPSCSLISDLVRKTRDLWNSYPRDILFRLIDEDLSINYRIQAVREGRIDSAQTIFDPLGVFLLSHRKSLAGSGA